VFVVIHFSKKIRLKKKASPERKGSYIQKTSLPQKRLKIMTIIIIAECLIMFKNKKTSEKEVLMIYTKTAP